MTSEKPKLWLKWLPLAQWWYNTNFHTGIKTTPFEALFGYPPPQLPLGSIPSSKVAAVDDVLKERHQVLIELKENLHKAQERMKRYADKSRTERKFIKGDWVFLKLQPYRQTSVHNRTNFKLSPRYFGPYDKIGEVAYRFNLPPGSQIHPVFHVSQLKKKVGDGVATSPSLPIISSDGRMKVVPVEILDRRMVKRNNAAEVELLIKWSNFTESDATWEDFHRLKQQFPFFFLGDKELEKKGGVSGTAYTIGHTTQGRRREKGIESRCNPCSPKGIKQTDGRDPVVGVSNSIKESVS